VFGWLREHEVAPSGPPFLRFYEVDHAGEPLDVEVGVPVEEARRATHLVAVRVT
jgi:hypothetical protein